MSDIKRMILAGFLITAILLFLPYYLNLIGYVSSDQQNNQEQRGPVSALKKDFSNFDSAEEPVLGTGSVDGETNQHSQQEKTFTVNTPKYSSTVSSLAGGSLTSYIITENRPQYRGGYNFSGEYNDSASVELILNNFAVCAPCVSVSSPSETTLLSVPFRVTGNHPPSSVLGQEDSLSLNFEHSTYSLKKKRPWTP